MDHTRHLEKLIERFLNAMKTERDARWTQGDIAQSIYASFGRKGIHKLSQDTGISERKLTMLRYTATRISPEIRTKFPQVHYSHFREAGQSSARFAPGSVESNPEWWLNKALEHGWTSDQLRAAGRFHTPETSPSSIDFSARLAWLHKRALAADHAFHEIEMAVSKFNEQHAVYFGSDLQLETRENLSASSKASA